MKPSVITGLVFLVALPFTLPGCTKEDPVPEKKLLTTAITNIVTEIAAIDKTCKTENNPEKRAIPGTSYGGNCAVYFGYQIPDVFKLIGPAG